jgi:hypothetical protein
MQPPKEFECFPVRRTITHEIAYREVLVLACDPQEPWAFIQLLRAQDWTRRQPNTPLRRYTEQLLSLARLQLTRGDWPPGIEGLRKQVYKQLEARYIRHHGVWIFDQGAIQVIDQPGWTCPKFPDLLFAVRTYGSGMGLETYSNQQALNLTRKVSSRSPRFLPWSLCRDDLLPLLDVVPRVADLQRQLRVVRDRQQTLERQLEELTPTEPVAAAPAIQEPPVSLFEHLKGAP